MADDKTNPKPEKGDDNAFAAIDMTQPVFIVFHQTETRNNIEVFQGPDAEANATAQRVKAALVSAEAKAHGYAIGQVRGPVVRVWVPESQSVRAMGGDRFKESKSAILDWIASKIGVTPQDLRGAA